MYDNVNLWNVLQLNVISCTNHKEASYMGDAMVTVALETPKMLKDKVKMIILLLRSSNKC